MELPFVFANARGNVGSLGLSSGAKEASLMSPLERANLQGNKPGLKSPTGCKACSCARNLNSPTGLLWGPKRG